MKVHKALNKQAEQQEVQMQEYNQTAKHYKINY